MGTGLPVPSRRTLATGIPALRSLGGNLAFAILAALGFLRRSIGTGNPSNQEKFREGPVALLSSYLPAVTAEW